MSVWEPEQLRGPGRWLVVTESSSYVVEMDEEGAGWLVRHAGEGGGPAPQTASLPPAVAVGLRGDGERIRVLSAVVPVVGQPWVILLDLRRDGVATVRSTTFVRSVIADPQA